MWICPHCQSHFPFSFKRDLPRLACPKCKEVCEVKPQADNSHSPPVPQPPDFGTGSELTALFKQALINPTSKCGCEAKAAEMNSWGSAGCLERKDELLAWLQTAYDHSSYLERIKAGVAAVVLGLPKSLERFLDLAIERAKEKEKWDPVRNCIYHVCPLEANDLWRKNVKQLLKRSGLFNGRKIAAIAVCSGCLPPSAVREAFAGSGFEFLEIPNDPQLREVASFLPLLELMAAEPGVTFYAHTKGNHMGTTGPDPRWIQGSIYWRNSMYAHLLDKWDNCRAFLRSFAAVGCHLISWPNKKQPYPSGLNHGNFMFAGTFFWFRNDRVFSNPLWSTMLPDRYFAEAWLSGLFTKNEVASVFQLWEAGGDYVRHQRSPYDPEWYIGDERREDD